MEDCPGLEIEIRPTGQKLQPYGVWCGSLSIAYLDFARAWMVLSGVSLGWRAANLDITEEEDAS